MAAISKILVPVDFSEGSAEALRQALTLRDKLGSSVDVIHTFEVPTFIPPHVVVLMGEVDAPLGVHAERHALEQLDDFLSKLGVADDATVSRRVMLGPPAFTILDVVEEEKHDLIVMGMHGRSGFARLVMGSTAEKILRAAPCPVLTVRVPGA